MRIHEFSTGIAVGGTPAQWWSNRFTGYMNLTLDKIPSSVQNTISHGLFKAAEGSVTGAVEPALIGREVKFGNDAWSVLATVTPAKDEKGRTISTYRYFLTEGIGNLGHLLNWYIREAKQPVFNPFEHKKVGDYSQYEPNQTKQPKDPLSKSVWQDLLNSEKGILVTPHDLKSTPLILHELAERRKTNNDLIAWAYQIEGLRKPSYFQAIHPASAKAERIFRKQLQNGQTPDRLVEGEYPLKRIINNIVHQGSLNLEQAQTLEKALNNPSYDRDFWSNSVFESLGFSSSPEVDSKGRLFLLKSLIIPETLPDFVFWLQNNPDFNGVLQEFSHNLNQQVSKLESIKDNNQNLKLLENAVYGIDSTMTCFNKLPAFSNWLKQDKMAVWGSLYQRYYRQRIIKDLKQISGNSEDNIVFLNNPNWSKLTQDIQELFGNQDSYQPNSQYQFLRDFFEEMGDNNNHPKAAKLDYRLAMFFEYMAQGSCSIGMCKKNGFYITPSQTTWNFFGNNLQLNRQLTWREKLTKSPTSLGKLIKNQPQKNGTHLKIHFLNRH
ncbi:MAG: hypothetical protein AB4062_13875 [Crocosphaera sp.]